MDPNYYATTLTNAALKLGPALIYLVVGFFLFIKLPFWILSKTVRSNRSSFDLGPNQDLKLEEYDAFIKRINDQSPGHRPKQSTKPESETKQQEKPKTEHKTAPPKTPPPPRLSREEVLFGLTPGQVIKRSELKRKYHELLMTHHPDKVASLAPEFRRIAEMKTKEINSAYNQLKKKAA